MKLSFAASVLAQTLPVVAQQAVATRKHDVPSSHPNMKVSGQATSTLPKEPIESLQACDPTSLDPDYGILSCEADRVCRSAPSVLGGFCFPNSKRASTSLRLSNVRGSIQDRMRDHLRHYEKVECDPTLVDVDLGVLSSCDQSQECIASPLSSLGGYCNSNGEKDSSPTEARGRRQLYTTQLCDPVNPFFELYPTISCDCADVNLSTNTGTMVCSLAFDFGIYNGCEGTYGNVSIAYSFIENEVAKVDTCYDVANEVSCAQYDYSDASCVISLNGAACTSCYVNNDEYYEFDCTNIEGGVSGLTSEYGNAVYFVPPLVACYEPPCRLCGEGLVIPPENFNTTVSLAGTDVSCYELAIADESLLFAGDACFEIGLVSLSECCPEGATLPPTKAPTSPPTEGPCEIVCGDDEFFDVDGTTDTGTPCFDFIQSLLTETFNSTTCDDLNEEAANGCCLESSASPTTTPVIMSESPTSMPEEMASAAPTASPPDDSSAAKHIFLWSTLVAVVTATTLSI